MTNTSWTVKKQKQIPWTPGQKQQVTYELRGSDLNCNVFRPEENEVTYLKHVRLYTYDSWYVSQEFHIQQNWSTDSRSTSSRKY